MVGYEQKISDQRRAIKTALDVMVGDSMSRGDEESAQKWRDYRRALAFKTKASPERYLAAWIELRKHSRSLKTLGISLPKKFLPEYRLTPNDDGTYGIENLSKQSSYVLTQIGDEDFLCTCHASEYGRECGHIKYAREMLCLEEDQEEPIIPTPTPIAQVEPPKEYDGPLPQLLPGITASRDQAIALQELMAFANGPDPIHGLFGFAGTGKSLLLQAWVRKLRESGYTKRIVFTAPVNKAVNVLQAMVDQWDLGIECITCAKLLGLKPVKDYKTGEQYFAPEYGTQASIGNYSIVVVDEASMINSKGQRDGLWEHLTEAVGFFTKLLFVGDYAQLPPVGETISKVFLEVQSPSRLTEVRRYDGAIAAIATDLRENLERKAEPYFKTEYSTDGTKGLFNLSSDSWMENCIKSFSSDKYLLDPNYTRALAWTNKRVDQLNAKIRCAIRGPQAPRFVEGDRLVANEHYMGNRERGELIATSQEMEVLEAFQGTSGSFECWFLRVRLFNRAGSTMLLPVLHENSLAEFNEEQEGLRKAKRWNKFWSNQGAFAWLSYAYAMTVHKSQGSTFQNVFVDVGDICRNNTRNKFTWPSGESQLIWERNQLLYVALTRASHRVFVCE